jgi:hypothetical protein
MEKERDIEEYWNQKAEELGEPIVMRSISHTYYRGIPDTFGILYASGNYLVYEYSKKGRKSLLESLFSRRGGEELNESVQMPRKQIRRAVLVNSNAARSWVRRSLQPREVLEKLEKRQELLCVSARIQTISLSIHLPTGSGVLCCRDRRNRKPTRHTVGWAFNFRT